LIEMLVVISIVSVLIAFLIPTLSTSREVARRAVCASTLRQFAIILTVYDQDYIALPPGEWGAKYLISGGAHIELRTKYNVFEKMTLCPSMARNTSSYRPWNNSNTTLGRLGYYYLAGHGNRLPDDGNYRFGWTRGTNYWPYAGTTDPVYFPALSILKNYGPSKNLPHDRQFLMLDIAYWNDLGLYNNAPQRSNHNINGKISAEGQNMSFLDGHVAWQQSRPNESWKLCQSYYNVIYWNPGFSAPTATPIYMPPLTVE
jgi:prepilin-type processing-associated H-X9-DG protein